MADLPVRILGLDLSLTSTGYCLIDTDLVAEPWVGQQFVTAAIWHGAVGFPQLREAERLAKFDEWITTTLRRRGDASGEHYVRIWPIDEVAIEGYSFGSISHHHSIGELGGVIKTRIFQHGVPMTVIPPATWRKVLTGKGNTAKQDVPLELFKRYGVEFPRIDTLEAWAVAMCRLRQIAGLDKPEPKASKRRSAGALLEARA
jgi:Holliday junction resolvasome RuvABC endonuclease subunit